MEDITSFYNNPNNDSSSKKESIFSGKRKSLMPNSNQVISSQTNLGIVTPITTNQNLNQVTINEEKNASTLKTIPNKKKNLTYGNINFCINVTNFIEIIDKVIKEKNEINQNLLFTDLLNKHKKGEKLNLNQAQFVEILLYFTENNLNFQNFCELMNIYQQNIEKSNTSFFFILLKSNKQILIRRNKASIYEIINQLNNFFLIVECETIEINNFIEDNKLVIEAIIKDSNDFLAYISNKKINRLMIKLEDNQKIKQTKLENIRLNTTTTPVNMGSKNALSPNTVNIITKIIDNSKTVNEFIYIKKYKVNRILPEAIQTGLLTINKYFLVEYHPVINNYKKSKLTFTLNEISGIIRFRYLYTFKSVNIFLYNSKRSKIFDFEDKELCQDFYDFVKTNAKKIDQTFDDIKYKTNLWIDGFMSNFDYLMYLNFMSCRSFSDLSQYPIMPWVINNYDDKEELDLSDEQNFRDLSKPIGAINPQRLNILKEKYNDMKLLNIEIPYLYGFHYSNPTIVKYYLTRTLPYHKLLLEEGTFGAPDRLFKSVKDALNSAMTRTEDFKEMIPE